MKVDRGWDHKTISAYLMGCFLLEKDELLLRAAADGTKRWNLTLVLDYENSIRRSKGFGGTVNYNKRLRRFDFIQYSDYWNWAVRFSIESGACWRSRDHRDFLYNNVPEAYHHGKKLSQWLLEH